MSDTLVKTDETFAVVLHNNVPLYAFDSMDEAREYVDSTDERNNLKIWAPVKKCRLED